MGLLTRGVFKLAGAHLRRIGPPLCRTCGRGYGKRWDAAASSSYPFFRAISTKPESDRIMSAEPVIVPSPHPPVSIPDNVGLAQYVIKNISKFGDRTALVNGVTGAETSFSSLVTSITRVASSLVRAGIGKGDVVTIFSANCPEFAIMYLAVAATGGIVSTINPVYTTGELSHALSHSGAKLLVTLPGLVDIAQAAVAECPELLGIVVFGEAEGCRSFSDMMADDGGAFPENLDFSPKEDMVALPYSSGTTGLPKGVMLSQYNIIANLEQIRTDRTVHLPYRGVLLGVLPFFHIYGQIVVLLSSLLAGCNLVIMPQFDATLYLHTIQSHRATFLHLVPPIVLFLAQHPMVDKYDLSSVKDGFTGAAPISGTLIEQFLSRMAHSITFRQGYGMTEASPVTHCNPPIGYKYDSVGPPVHNTESKVVDVTSGATLGYGHEGEVWVRGPQIMLGYFKNEEATAKTITEDGWLRTGDIGYCQPDAHFYITDRLKELIKVKGFQVAPAELEAMLIQHEDVVDAAVIGVPDERSGELPRAYIVLKPGSSTTDEDIKDYIKDKVAPFKNLAGGVEFISQIPKSASGKILRRNLKSAYMDK